MKLEDVEVGMKVVPHSKFEEFTKAKLVRRKNDNWLYVVTIDDAGIIHLSPDMHDLTNITFFLPSDFEQWCDADEAPDGYYAIPQRGCDGCALRGSSECMHAQCDGIQRNDGCSVIYKQRAFCKEKHSTIGTIPVTVETSIGAKANAQIEPDPVNNPSHYASGEIECIDAIKASMSKEAFRGFLKGNVLKYLWRYEKKVNPEEDIKKAGWYRERLEKELEDESRSY